MLDSLTYLICMDTGGGDAPQGYDSGANENVKARANVESRGCGGKRNNWSGHYTQNGSHQSDNWIGNLEEFTYN